MSKESKSLETEKVDKISEQTEPDVDSSPVVKPNIDSVTTNDIKVKETTNRIARKAQRTERKQLHPQLLSKDSEEDLLQTIPEVSMAKEKKYETNGQNPEDTD